jgi:hypothetical protein
MDTYYINEKRINQKNIDELIGICQGILADNLINKDEIDFIYGWIQGKFSKDEIKKFFIVNYIYNNLEKSLETSNLNDKDFNNFKNKLKNIISLDSILDNINSIENNSICCCSGIFSEDKTTIKQILKNKNITITKNVTLDINYLIIGSLGNPEWKHGLYGNKIEKAIDYRDKKKTGLVIISEQQLLKYL